MHHQLQRCAGYTLLHSTFPELALFRIFACIQHQIPVGLFASLDNTDRYYLPLFFYPDRYYKHPNFDEKHSKCNFKPAKEAIRLQKKILLCKSTMLFHLHLLSGKSNASFTKSGFYPNTRKRNSLRGSALKITAPETRFWTRSGSKPKIGGKSNFYHFLSENRPKNGLKTL